MTSFYDNQSPIFSDMILNELPWTEARRIMVSLDMDASAYWRFVQSGEDVFIDYAKPDEIKPPLEGHIVTGSVPRIPVLNMGRFAHGELIYDLTEDVVDELEEEAAEARRIDEVLRRL